MLTSDLLAALAAPSPCPDCHAYTTQRRDPRRPAVLHVTVHHDDTCPTLRARRRGGRP